MGFPSDRDLLAGRGHHESDAEFYGRTAVRPAEPKEVRPVNIKVSIPVEVGGYTGQRDAWQSHTRDFNVDFEDDGRVVLEYAGVSYEPRKIWFDLDELQKAVDFVRREGGQQ